MRQMWIWVCRGCRYMRERPCNFRQRDQRSDVAMELLGQWGGPGGLDEQHESDNEYQLLF